MADFQNSSRISNRKHPGIPKAHVKMQLAGWSAEEAATMVSSYIANATTAALEDIKRRDNEKSVAQSMNQPPKRV